MGYEFMLWANLLIYLFFPLRTVKKFELDCVRQHILCIKIWIIIFAGLVTFICLFSIFILIGGSPACISGTEDDDAKSMTDNSRDFACILDKFVHWRHQKCAQDGSKDDKKKMARKWALSIYVTPLSLRNIFMHKVHSLLCVVWLGFWACALCNVHVVVVVSIRFVSPRFRLCAMNTRM